MPAGMLITLRAPRTLRRPRHHGSSAVTLPRLPSPRRSVPCAGRSPRPSAPRPHGPQREAARARGSSGDGLHAALQSFPALYGPEVRPLARRKARFYFDTPTATWRTCFFVPSTVKINRQEQRRLQRDRDAAGPNIAKGIGEIEGRRAVDKLARVVTSNHLRPRQQIKSIQIKTVERVQLSAGGAGSRLPRGRKPGHFVEGRYGVYRNHPAAGSRRRVPCMLSVFPAPAPVCRRWRR